MNKISFYGIVATLVMSAFVLTSCDQDFSEIGSGIVDENHFSSAPDVSATVTAYSQKTGAVQSNNLPINALGLYNDPVFGKVKANFVTQLELGTLNPEFDAAKNQVLDSVVLTIPYFSTKTTNSAFKEVYKLDSIKGKAPIDLKVFESGFVLNDLDPLLNFSDQQRYYTDQDGDFNANKKGTMLNNSAHTNENTAFVPDSIAYVSFKKDRGLKKIDPEEVEARLSPRMRLKLDKTFFEQKILNAPQGKLLNNSVFKEYFRGIYFQVGDGSEGTLMQLDFSKGDITLHYHEFAKVEDGVPVKFPSTDLLYGGDPILVARTLVLNMKGNTVNLLENENSTLYGNGIANPNRTEGDANLFLKGGEGSVAIIDLFGADYFGEDGLTGAPDGVADELNIIRKKAESGWLVNEANLTFYIDQQKMSASPNPYRMYLYDLNNNRPLIDWSKDVTSGGSKPKKSKYIHDGIIQKVDNKGVKYRIRITDHIRALVRQKDSTNVRLGLSITEAIGITASLKLKSPQVLSETPDKPLVKIPAGSLLNPLGSVLFGNNIAPNDPNYEKRLKLEIYYTKPN